jgi:hypothetical protein
MKNASPNHCCKKMLRSKNPGSFSQKNNVEILGYLINVDMYKTTRASTKEKALPDVVTKLILYSPERKINAINDYKGRMNLTLVCRKYEIRSREL